MIPSVLIANRGEIARRITRTAKRLGIRSIAVYSEADAAAPFVSEADEAYPIGPAAARESYLAPEKILAAARLAGAAAIHPGYGFLSENADFAEAVIAAGLVWIGPRPASIRAMGLKDAAKALMMAAGVPTTPGYLGEDQSEPRLRAEADRIGYPVLIKAVAGGGGKGMRKVTNAAAFTAGLAACRREAAAAFGDDRVLLEIYVARPRHIEVQVFGDRFGNIVHLFERDCSLQRRHQKVIEEAPAPGMTADIRAAICDAAIKAARAVDYEGAGTIEFIADASGADASGADASGADASGTDASGGLRADRIWFMEMNTRLQVEHPVTEAVTGQDLVEWQFRIASGEPLPLAQDRITLTGHAIEARLYAENPETGFLPSIGPLTHFKLPRDDVRIDSAVEQGGEVTPDYDPMIAKLIAHAPNRATAARHLAAACRAIEIWPVKTNAALLANALDQENFIAGAVDTGFIEAHLEPLIGATGPSPAVLAAAGAARLARYQTPAPLIGFRLNAPPRTQLRLQQAGQTHVIDIAIPPGPSHLAVATHGDQTIVFDAGRAFAFTEPTVAAGDHADAGDGAVRSPMPGHILSVAVAEGDIVAKGAPLLVIEAMKMEMTMTAPIGGVVTGLAVGAGQLVAEGVLLLSLGEVK